MYNEKVFKYIYDMIDCLDGNYLLKYAKIWYYCLSMNSLGQF